MEKNTKNSTYICITELICYVAALTQQGTSTISQYIFFKLLKKKKVIIKLKLHLQRGRWCFNHLREVTWFLFTHRFWVLLSSVSSSRHQGDRRLRRQTRKERDPEGGGQQGCVCSVTRHPKVVTLCSQAKSLWSVCRPVKTLLQSQSSLVREL